MWKLSAIAGALLSPAVAAAQPIEGLYVSGEAGANFAGDLQSSHDTTKVDTDVGPVGLAALGWRFNDNLRVEIEGSYRSNDIDGISTLRTTDVHKPLTDVDGSADTYAVMANVAYDIPIRPFGLPLRPYIGAGVGYGWLDFDNARGDGVAAFRVPDNVIVGRGPDVVRFGTAGAFAYQAIVGAALPLHGLPGLELTAEYRFFGMARVDTPVTRTTTSGELVNGIVPSSSTRNGFVIQDSAALIGMRYRFGAL